MKDVEKNEVAKQSEEKELAESLGDALSKSMMKPLDIVEKRLEQAGLGSASTEAFADSPKKRSRGSNGERSSSVSPALSDLELFDEEDSGAKAKAYSELKKRITDGVEDNATYLALGPSRHLIFEDWEPAPWHPSGVAGGG